MCILEDIYTPAEVTLMGAGAFEQVRQNRVVFQDVTSGKVTGRSRSAAR